MLRITYVFVRFAIVFGPALVPLVIASRRWRRDERSGRFRSLSGLVALLCVGLSIFLVACAFGYFAHIPYESEWTDNDWSFSHLIQAVGSISALIAIVTALLARSGIRGMIVISALWCFAISWLVTSPPGSGDSGCGPTCVSAAVGRLSRVQEYAFDSDVGFCWTTSNGEIDFERILAMPNPTALNAFEKLYAIGNPQGKSYALSGIKRLNPQRFNELKKSIATSIDEVIVRRGCILLREPLRHLAQQIDSENSGAYPTR